MPAAVTKALAWGGFGAVVGAVVGFVVAALWSPFLLSRGVRDTFVGWPTRWWSLNYLLAAVLASAVHASLLRIGLELTTGATPTLNVVVGTELLVPVLGWLIAISRLDSGREFGTKALLAAGAGWYVLVTTGPLVVLTFFYYLPM